MKKGVIYFIIVSVLVGAMLSGCEKSVKSDTAGSKTFTYWANIPTALQAEVSNMGDVLMYSQREKDSGVHIKFIHPPVGQAREQFNLMIASLDLPDMIEYNAGLLTYQGGPQKAISDGIVIPVTKYVDKHAPNFIKTVKTGKYPDSYRKGSTTDDGDFFGFPLFHLSDLRTYDGLLMRKDWLDELNLQVPETLDEWTAVLQEFKTKKNARTPYTGSSKAILADQGHFSGAFGVGNDLYLDGDKVKYGPFEPGFKEYLNYMREWYAKGLLDNDFYTNNNQMVDTKILTDSAGSYNGGLTGGIAKYLESTENPNFNVVAAPSPVLKKGDVNSFGSVETDVRSTYLLITSACHNPELAIEWMDFWYSDEGILLSTFGVEGISYNMIDGKPIYTDFILNNPDGHTMALAMSLAFRQGTSSSAPGFTGAPGQNEQRYRYEQQQHALTLWSQNTEEFKKTTLPILMPTLEQSNELALIETDLNTYRDEMILKFIQGKESLDNYDAFVTALKTNFNAGRYLEIQQAMYDRYIIK